MVYFFTSLKNSKNMASLSAKVETVEVETEYTGLAVKDDKGQLKTICTDFWALRSPIDQVVQSLAKQGIYLYSGGVAWDNPRVGKDDQFDYERIVQAADDLRYYYHPFAATPENAPFVPSYGFKHEVERLPDAVYITNGDCIMAALIVGYVVKWNKGDINAEIQIKRRDFPNAQQIWQGRAEYKG